MSVGHVELVPEHVSAGSHIPVDALHTLVRYLSMHVLLVPLHLSVVSHAPLLLVPVHVVVAGEKLSVGHGAPAHVSAMSHVPALALHVPLGAYPQLFPVPLQ
jgi:hypothetical protein